MQTKLFISGRSESTYYIKSQYVCLYLHLNPWMKWVGVVVSTALLICAIWYIIVIRTTKRPVPLEHCLFYSGEFYKVCESEKFIALGLKAAKDAYKKKNTSNVSGGTGRYSSGSSASHDVSQTQKRATSIRSTQNKHSGSQNLGSSSWAGLGNQNNGSSQNNWGSRRS